MSTATQKESKKHFPTQLINQAQLQELLEKHYTKTKKGEYWSEGMFKLGEMLIANGYAPALINIDLSKYDNIESISFNLVASNVQLNEKYAFNSKKLNGDGFYFGQENTARLQQELARLEAQKALSAGYVENLNEKSFKTHLISGILGSSYTPPGEDPHKLIEKENEANEILEKQVLLLQSRMAHLQINKKTDPSLSGTQTTSPLEKKKVPVSSRRYKNRLFLGEADFSYTTALLKKHADGLEGLKDKKGLGKAITATELSSQSDIEQVFRSTYSKNREYLLRQEVDLLHGVNATSLHTDSRLKKDRYKRIHFNYPHDKSNFKKRTLPKIIEGFFSSAKRLQINGDRIHVTLPKISGKDDFYQSYVYGIYDASARAGYKLIRKREFNKVRYSHYQHRETDTAESAGVAEVGREYIFERTNLTYEEIVRITPPRKKWIPPNYPDGGKNFNFLPKEPDTAKGESSDYSDDSDIEEDSVENLPLKKVEIKNENILKDINVKKKRRTKPLPSSAVGSLQLDTDQSRDPEIALAMRAADEGALPVDQTTSPSSHSSSVTTTTSVVTQTHTLPTLDLPSNSVKNKRTSSHQPTSIAALAAKVSSHSPHPVRSNPPKSKTPQKTKGKEFEPTSSPSRS